MATSTPRRSTNGRRSAEPNLDLTGPEIQGFDVLRHLPIGLPDKARRASCLTLNGILADSMILYAMYKKHHWLVAGPTFDQLHSLFDRHAEEQTLLIDELAERIQLLGGIAVGDPRHAAELTTIERPPDGAEPVAVMIDRLVQAHGVILAKVRRGIESTEESKDWGTNDLLMGDVLRRNELHVWFLAQHLVDVPLVDA